MGHMFLHYRRKVPGQVGLQDLEEAKKNPQTSCMWVDPRAKYSVYSVITNLFLLGWGYGAKDANSSLGSQESIRKRAGAPALFMNGEEAIN